MSDKIAIASSDGTLVDQHFRGTEKFFIYQKNDETYEFFETRINEYPSVLGQHNDNMLFSSIDLISDCKIVLASQIGRGAERELERRGIKTFAIKDSIDKVLDKLQKYNKKIRRD